MPPLTYHLLYFGIVKHLPLCRLTAVLVVFAQAERFL